MWPSLPRYPGAGWTPHRQHGGCGVQQTLSDQRHLQLQVSQEHGEGARLQRLARILQRKNSKMGWLGQVPARGLLLGSTQKSITRISPDPWPLGPSSVLSPVSPQESGCHMRSAAVWPMFIMFNKLMRPPLQPQPSQMPGTSPAALHT